MIVATVPQFDLETIAHNHSISPALALGLGAGLYFEYLRRSEPSPTHSIAGLDRDIQNKLVRRLASYRDHPKKCLRDSLRETALLFNLDRAPTTVLDDAIAVLKDIERIHRAPGYDYHT